MTVYEKTELVCFQVPYIAWLFGSSQVQSNWLNLN